jgi:hypothetical protein
MAFDYTTDVRDKKTGKIVAEQHYVRVTDSKGTRLERPPGSGKWYTESGELIKSHDMEVESSKAAKVSSSK